MRILIAAHGYPPTHSAGAERRAERTAKWLVQGGHQVTVLAVESLTEPGFRIDIRQQDGLPIHRLYYHLDESSDPFHDLYHHPRVQQAAADLLASEPFDLVHIISGYLVGAPVIAASRAAQVPVVITLTEYFFLCARLNLIQATGALCTGPESDAKCMRCLMEDKRRYRLGAQTLPLLMDAFWMFGRHLPFATNLTAKVAERRAALRSALDSADAVICPSRFLIGKFEEFGFDTRHYHFIRQGLNVPTEKPAPVPRPADGTLRLGYIGQIKPHKGVDLLIDAVLRLTQTGRRVQLDVWGAENEAPDYVGELKRRSAMQAAICWNGRYTGAKVWEVLAGLDVLVVPSRWYENSPNVILEAHAMGMPVIATDLGGMAELVEHEKSGLLFRLNDADDLRRQIERLLDEPDLLAWLRAGIPRVKTMDGEMQEIAALYEEVLQAHRGSSGVNP